MTEREKHLLAGLDDRHRGFSRIAEIEPQEGGCTASFRYERMVIVGPLSGTAEKALADLVLMLHERGYTELRTCVTFRGERYLGSQEAWLEYPDIHQRSQPPQGVLGMLRTLWRSRSTRS